MDKLCFNINGVTEILKDKFKNGDYLNGFEIELINLIGKYKEKNRHILLTWVMVWAMKNLHNDFPDKLFIEVIQKHAMLLAFEWINLEKDMGIDK